MRYRPLRILVTVLWLTMCLTVWVMILGPDWYPLELMASLPMQSLVLLGSTSVLIWVIRGHLAATLGAITCAIGAFVVFSGRTIWYSSSMMPAGATGFVRICSLNLGPANPDWESALRSINSLEADIVILLEVPNELMRSLRSPDPHHGAFEPWGYSAFRYGPEDDRSRDVILSRWPISPTQDPAAEPTNAPFLRIIDTPLGRVGIGGLHPASPRTRTRWEAGNRAVEQFAMDLAHLNSSEQIPWYIGTDLNGGPASARAVSLRRAGLEMSKPLFGGLGSYPSYAGLAAVQIDDVWTDQLESIARWNSVFVAGSDHRLIVVDCCLESGPHESPERITLNRGQADRQEQK